jgi:hypothetical protein
MMTMVALRGSEATSSATFQPTRWLVLLMLFLLLNYLGGNLPHRAKLSRFQGTGIDSSTLSIYTSRWQQNV